MFPTDKEIPKFYSEESSKRDNITYAFKGLRHIFNAFSHQKLTFKGNKFTTLSTKAKLYPPLLWILVISLYFGGGIIPDGIRVTKLMSGSTHLIAVNLVIILSSSICSSTFKYCRLNYKYTQNAIYLDNKLKIPTSWYTITRRRVTLIFVLCIIFDAFVWVYNIVVWYDMVNRHNYVIYMLTTSADMIIFQYVFDVWIIVNRLKILTTHLIALVLPANYKENIGGDYQIDWVLENNPKEQNNECEKSRNESFEDGILRLMSVFDKLADNVCIVNTTYGMQMVFVTAYCLVANLSVSNCLMVLISGKIPLNPLIVGDIINWFIHGLLLFSSYVAVAEILKSEYNQTMIVINKLQIFEIVDKSIQKRLSTFENQMKGRPMVLTACGLFPLDATLVYSFIATIAAYTVILYQLNSL